MFFLFLIKLFTIIRDDEFGGGNLGLSALAVLSAVLRILSVGTPYYSFDYIKKGQIVFILLRFGICAIDLALIILLSKLNPVGYSLSAHPLCAQKPVLWPAFLFFKAPYFIIKILQLKSLKNNGSWLYSL